MLVKLYPFSFFHFASPRAVLTSERGFVTIDRTKKTRPPDRLNEMEMRRVIAQQRVRYFDEISAVVGTRGGAVIAGAAA